MVTFDLEITTSACGLLVMTKIALSAGSYGISLSSWEPSLLGEYVARCQRLFSAEK
jgi:hypothetical protein